MGEIGIFHYDVTILEESRQRLRDRSLDRHRQACPATIAKRRVSILVYHDPAPELFEMHLKYLSKRYNFVSLGEVVDAMTNDRWSELPDRSLVLTLTTATSGTPGRGAHRPLRGQADRLPLQPADEHEQALWFLDVRDPERFKPLANGKRLATLEEAGFTPTEITTSAKR